MSLPTASTGRGLQVCFFFERSTFGRPYSRCAEHSSSFERRRDRESLARCFVRSFNFPPPSLDFVGTIEISSIQSYQFASFFCYNRARVIFADYLLIFLPPRVQPR